jgi:P27 family predicted phage terminase small subunit
MRGRKPTPHHLKVLRGNPGHRPIRPEPQPSLAPKPPEPPPFLSAYAATEWRRIAPELHWLGLLTVVDVAPFAAYCQAFAKWRQALESLEGTGLLVTADGITRAHPLVLIARQAAADMLKFAGEFGLTPVARARIGGGRQQGGGGKFGGLIA